MPAPLQILGFGSVAIDETIYVDRPLSAGKGRITHRAVNHGGNVATALCAAASLGARAGFVGRLSNQSEFASVIDAFEEAGVDISFAAREPDAKPVTATVIVGSDGDRFIAFEDARFSASDLLEPSILAEAQVLLVDSYAFSSVSFVTKARASGLQIVADVEWSVGPATDEVMRVIDHPILPWEFAAAFTGQNEPSAILRGLWTENRAATVVTKGADGAFVLQKNDPTIWHLPAHSVEALDTTGCGDCFHGAYAVALVSGKTPLECARYASAAAAISATGHGGRGALPDHQAVMTLMADGIEPVPLSREQQPA